MAPEPHEQQDAGRGGRRVVVAGLAALAGLGVVVAVTTMLRAQGAPEETPGAVEETPPPPAVVEPDEPGADEQPDDEEPVQPPGTPTPPPGFDELVASITEQVADLRGLQPRTPVHAEAQQADELAETVAEIAARHRDDAELETRQRILAALRLLPADLDLEAILEDLLGEQIAGLYSPEDEVLYVRSDDPGDLSPGEEVTLAHEIVHALQDQAFGLDRFLELPDDDPDATLAAQALVEGDAVLTQELWSFQHQSEEERAARLLELGDIDTSALEAAPRYLRESLLFPYQEGLGFVEALYERDGFETVDQAFASPPTTSAHILDPERYLEGEQPVEVDPGGSPGTDWTPLGEYTLGAFDLRSLLWDDDPETATALAHAWAGGRLAAWGRDDETALSVALAFRSDAQARDACDAVARWYEQAAGGTRADEPGVYDGDGDAAAVRCEDPGEVRLGLAPEADVARTLAGG